jgi:hypothetical protein
VGTTLWFFHFHDGAPAPVSCAEVEAILAASGVTVDGDVLVVPDDLAAEGSWHQEDGGVVELAFERVVLGPRLDRLATALVETLDLTAIGSWGDVVVPPGQREHVPPLDGTVSSSWPIGHRDGDG